MLKRDGNMSIIFFIIYGFFGWKYGNWKEFRKYYPTLLYFIIGDFLYQFLLFDHTMWLFHPVGQIEKALHFNHTIIALGKMAIQYPVTIAIFLGRLNSNAKERVLSIFLWIGIYAITQVIAHFFGGITYHNGWNFGWDLIFNSVMFPLLLLHYSKPLYAWILTLPVVLGLWWIFDVPYSVLK